MRLREDKQIFEYPDQDLHELPGELYNEEDSVEAMLRQIWEFEKQRERDVRTKIR